jgi:hypothetical protein
MKILLWIAGMLVLVFGVFIGIAGGNLIVILLSIVGGFILLGLSKIIDLVEQINDRSLHMPYTHNQIRTILQASPEYVIDAGQFEIYPNPETLYALLYLDGEAYIRARVFRNYLSQRDDEYTFSFPDRQPKVMIRANHYYQGVELFGQVEQVFVMLRSIHLKPRISGYKVFLEEL